MIIHGQFYDGIVGKPDLDDALEHYGIKGMKWYHRIRKGTKSTIRYLGRVNDERIKVKGWENRRRLASTARKKKVTEGGLGVKKRPIDSLYRRHHVNPTSLHGGVYDYSNSSIYGPIEGDSDKLNKWRERETKKILEKEKIKEKIKEKSDPKSEYNKGRLKDEQRAGKDPTYTDRYTRKKNNAMYGDSRYKKKK